MKTNMNVSFLTTSKPSATNTSTTTSTRSTGVASSDVLFRPLESESNKGHNIVMTCLKMLLQGEEPLEGVNCINQALTDEFDTFNFTTSISRFFSVKSQIHNLYASIWRNFFLQTRKHTFSGNVVELQ